MQVLKELQKFDSDLVGIPMTNPSFSVFKCLYFSTVSLWRQDLRAIYRRYCKSTSSSSAHPFPEAQQKSAASRRRATIITFISKPSRVPRASLPGVELDSSVSMRAEEFAEFLAFSQDRDYVDSEEAAAIIKKYDTFVEKSDTSWISLKGFTHYMLNQETSPPLHLQSQQVTANMNQPLSDYLIASSHNTYLTGHQLHGESSVSMYIKVGQTLFLTSNQVLCQGG